MKAKFLGALKRLSKKAGVYGPLSRVRYQFSDYQRQLQAEKAFYAPFVKPGQLVFDVGANVGRKTQAFLELGARVVAFEPQPECAEEIELRCGHNERLHVHQCALGAKETTAQLDVSQRSELAKVLNEKLPTSLTITVEVRPLDQFVEQHGVPSFCKIDVEGFELQVLKGLSRFPDAFSIEYHATSAEQVAETEACLDHILSLDRNYELNYTARTNTIFESESWHSVCEFKNHFAENWQKMPTFGDIVFRHL